MHVNHAGIGPVDESTKGLPAVAAPQGASTSSFEPRAPDADPESVRILVVDDDHDSAESLALLLRLDRHEVHIAYDGEQAVELANSVHPELAFIDLGMPGVGGDEVARRIRKEQWGRDILLVVLTGWSRPDDRRMTTDAGFDHHLVKPIDAGVLTRIVSEVHATRAGGSPEPPQ